MDNQKRRTVVALYLFSFMTALGLSTSMFSTIQPEIIAHYGIDLTQASLFSVYQEIGSLSAMAITTLVVDRMNKNRLIGVMFFLMGIFLYAMGMMPAFLVLLVMRALLGIVSSVVNNTCSASISDLYGEDRSRHLALLHTLFGVGSLLGPPYATMLMQLGSGWNSTYTVIGSVVILIAVSYFATVAIIKEPTPQVSNIGQDGRRKKIPFRLIFSSPNMLALCFTSFLFNGYQLIMVWLPTYLASMNHDISMRSVIMTLFFVGMIISRLGYSYLSKWVKPHQYMQFASLSSATVLVLALILQGTWTWIICTLLLGILSGAVYTVQFVLACQQFPEYSASATSMTTLFAAIGGMLFSPLIGTVAENGHFTLAMAIPAAAMGLIFFIMRYVYKPVQADSAQARG